MGVLKNKREIQNYEKLRVIGLFCYTRVFLVYHACVSHKLQALYARGNAAITNFILRESHACGCLLTSLICLFACCCFFWYPGVFQEGLQT